MTRPALSSPPAPNRLAAGAAVGPAPRPDGGFHHGRGRRTPADMLFAILVEARRGPIVHRKPHPCRLPPSRGWGMRADTTHACEVAGARRVVIIGCEHRLFVHTLSKNWAMTVRQTGWLQVHPSLGQKTENMIPYVASAVRPTWPRTPVAFQECRDAAVSWALRGGDRMRRLRGRPQGRAQAMAAYLDGRTDPHRRTRRSIINAPAGYRGMGSPGFAPVWRGIRYNWKGPPIKLPLRVPGSLSAQGAHTV
jgi:hypothetical protein